MIIQIVVTQNDFFKIEKDHLQQLNEPQWSYGFEIFSRHYIFIKS